MRTRKPDGISEHLWEECTAWASTAQGNICFSEGHASYTWMSQFEKQLDEKLKEEVNLSTIEWIGHCLAESGPYGEEYFANMQWWQRWEDLVQAVERESKH